MLICQLKINWERKVGYFQKNINSGIRTSMINRKMFSKMGMRNKLISIGLKLFINKISISISLEKVLRFKSFKN